MQSQRKDQSLDELEAKVKTEFHRALASLDLRTVAEQKVILLRLLDNLKAIRLENLSGMRYSEESKSLSQQLHLMLGSSKYTHFRSLCTCTMNLAPISLSNTDL